MDNRMETRTTTPMDKQLNRHQQPRFFGLSHISLACRDVAESKRFYTEVMGGELIHSISGFAEVRVAGMIIGMSEQSGGWTGWDDEYLHFAFDVDGANFVAMKSWLDSWDVPAYPWTRNHKTALMYFRDPSGNLIELYCDSGYQDIARLPLGPRQGGQPLPLGELNYRWQGKQSRAHGTVPNLLGLAHLSVPCRDVDQSRRFFVEVLGGEPVPTSDPATFAEVRIAGAILGFSTRSGSPPRPDAEYPHYAFFADAENFLPMIDWLKKQGVTTPGPWTRDGKRGLMYFRDPSGNLFEIYCPGGLQATESFPRGVKQGGQYATDFASLFYDWGNKP
jgi:catechol 2,3-dioxygenase-like lactoylglutathione lyase family enzyme